jgi:anti-anti-sigma factor
MPQLRARGYQPCSGPGREQEAIEVRLHAPAPQVVVVRVSGVLDGATAPLLVERVEPQFEHALDVVIDLDDVDFLADCAMKVLRTLHHRAVDVGSRLHLAAEHRAI